MLFPYECGPKVFRYTDRMTHIDRPKKAIQNKAAITAVTMKFRGETSNEVSETIRPNAKQVNIVAADNIQSNH
jgi:hypothetical protein